MTSTAKRKIGRHRRRGNKAGEELMEGLRELRDAMTSGNPAKLTMRQLEIPEPSAYGPKQVKTLREALGVSQALFAHLLAVSPILIAHWEAGVRQPSGLACRLLDKVKDDPGAFLATLVRRKTVA